MKKVYLIPETLVRVPSLILCELSTSDTEANPNLPVPEEGKERYEEEEEGYGHYQW